MTNDLENGHRPLPVVLRPVADELLSSWMVRHAAYYGVTASFFAQWLILGTRNLSALDHRLGLGQVARLSEKFRCDPITLIGMTFVDAPGRSDELIRRGRAPQICRACADRHARGRLGRGPETLAESLACHLPHLRRAPLRHQRAPRCPRDLARHQPFRAPMAGSLGRRGDHRALPSRR
jgi:hypothetical protein